MTWMLWGSGLAYGFCGAYVGTADSAPTNTTSHVVWALEGETTTLTMYNDVSVAKKGAEIGLLLPLNTALGEADIQAVDIVRFGELEAATAPRSVSHSCASLPTNGLVSQQNAAGCGAPHPLLGLTEPSVPSDVVVYDRFTAGSWDVSIVDATTPDALVDWLLDEGFDADAATLETVEAVLDAGEFVLAAKVSAEAEWLTPLQIRYPEPVFTLPVALGTRSSTGVQDLVIHTITSGQAVDIANYPRVDVQSDCIFDAELATVEEVYEGLLDEALQPSEGRATWTREYARGWGAASGGKCDPCETPPPDVDDSEALDDALLAAFGFEGGAATGFVTRLHIRYAAGEVDQDLVLQPTTGGLQHQQRYIVASNLRELYEAFPECGVATPSVPTDRDLIECAPPEAVAQSTGCSTAPSGWTGVFAALGLLTLRRRRR